MHRAAGRCLPFIGHWTLCRGSSRPRRAGRTSLHLQIWPGSRQPLPEARLISVAASSSQGNQTSPAGAKEKTSADKPEPSAEKPESKPKSPDEAAWDEVDCSNKDSLQEYLRRFPQGKYAVAAKEAIEMLDKIAAIRGGKIKPAYIIPFEALGYQWAVRRKRNPNRGAIAYYVDARSGVTFMFCKPPEPFTGGKTCSIALELDLIPPVGDGSIIAFQTYGSRYEWLPGGLFPNTRRSNNMLCRN